MRYDNVVKAPVILLTPIYTMISPIDISLWSKERIEIAEKNKLMADSNFLLSPLVWKTINPAMNHPIIQIISISVIPKSLKLSATY